MSTLVKTAQLAGAIAAVVATGTIYVLVHEARRKAKKAAKKTAAGAGSSVDNDILTAERLIFVLGESANGAYQLIEQTRRMVHERHVASGQSLEACVDEMQKDFEAAMEAVIASIRQKNGVTEQMMSAAMVQHQADPVVQAAVTALREAINGKAPPGYAAAAEAAQAESAKQRVRRAASGKQRRKG